MQYDLNLRCKKRSQVVPLAACTDGGRQDSAPHPHGCGTAQLDALRQTLGRLLRGYCPLLDKGEGPEPLRQRAFLTILSRSYRQWSSVIYEPGAYILPFLEESNTETPFVLRGKWLRLRWSLRPITARDSWTRPNTSTVLTGT